MDDGRKRVNIRIYEWHLQSQAAFPWLSVYTNPAHRKGSGLDAKTKLRIGEFRDKPNWLPFAVYRFFGMV